MKHDLPWEQLVLKYYEGFGLNEISMMQANYDFVFKKKCTYTVFDLCIGWGEISLEVIMKEKMY